MDSIFALKVKGEVLRISISDTRLKALEAIIEGQNRL